jgi:YggT family protein
MRGAGSGQDRRVSNPFWQYWYFHIPNYLLAALMYTLLGRFLLGLFVPPDWNNYIWRFFRRVTDPVLAVTARITPRFMLGALMPLVAVFWIILLRLAYWMLLARLELAPRLGVDPTGA